MRGWPLDKVTHPPRCGNRRDTEPVDFSYYMRAHNRTYETSSRWLRCGGVLACLALVVLPSMAGAAPLVIEDIERTPMGEEGGYAINMLWTVVTGMLVFWMQAGFAFVEAGFTRAKNVINILMKNLMDQAVGSLAFWAVGFGLMFGTSYMGLFGTDGFFLSGYGDRTETYSFLFFQTMFCATAATIVSGAMAERTHFPAYLWLSLVVTTLIYPVFGSWTWGGLFSGGGWLQAPQGGLLDRWGLPPFIDFAGSSVVHSVGGWCALAGVIALGPRIGKFDRLGRPQPIMGHSITLATLGCFILWMGWFAFNAGSTGGVTGSGNSPFSGSGKAIGLVAFNTHIAGCAGAASAMFTSWRLSGKPDIGLTINGALGALVAVTAGCAFVTPMSAVLIGAIGGVVVVLLVLWTERFGLDDPVGAISVHAGCGTWGTVAVAVFHHDGFRVAQLATQLIGIGACFLWTFGMATLTLRILRATIGLRVSFDAEVEGLDWAEHASEGYPPDLAPGPADVRKVGEYANAS